ncbi:unnamed protein product [Rotaria sp. Silwood2]|nr:unnamed protein product [Rotaria sp. Silwood2]
MGGEDFASMLEQVPGAYIMIGNGISSVSGVKTRVKNKCSWSLKVHIGNGDSGRWIGAGGDSWGYNGRSDGVWAEQPGIWGDNTLVEIHDDNGHIWYDISLVDGFTYPIALVPVGGGEGNRRNLYCITRDILNQCPDNLKVQVDGNVRASGKSLLAMEFYSPLREVSAGDRISGCKFYGIISRTKDTMTYYL